MSEKTLLEIDRIVKEQLTSGAYEHVSCNLCRTDTPVLFAINHYNKGIHARRMQCSNCGLVYSDPQATESTLKHYYATADGKQSIEEIVRHHESLVPQYSRIFSNLAKKKKPGTFLDIGCSTGYFIDIGRKSGWDVYGIDISSPYIKYAREKFGLLNVECTDLFDAKYPDDFFEYVWLWHVLEHVKDPMGLLLEINRITKPGGEIRIGVPCVKDPIYHLKWRGCGIKGFSSDAAHTFEFVPKALKKMIKKAGFDLACLEVYYNPGSLTKLLGFRSSWKAKKIIFFLYYLSRAVPNRFGHRLAVNCVKG